MPAPKLILDLVQRFEDLEIKGELKDCNEARTRNDFINLFFEALGWDIRNERCTREVVLEECKQAAKQTMYPDYTFCLAAKPKFFVEAKRPSVPLPSDQNAAFQLRRYGYSAGLSLSILTNFAYLAIYDCRIKPNIHDPSTIARWRFYHYKQYETKWAEIASLFAQEAVFNGSLNQFETENKPKRVHVPMEKAFLQQINEWRDKLAHNFFAVNPGLTQEDLNFAVQMTINRLLFLRICEDHGIEPYRKLQQLLPKPDSPPENDYTIYPQLCILFQEADLRYNAGLFHFSPQKGRPSAHDILTLNLRVSNKTLIPIIEGLDPELCPYAFQVIPVEILGQIYEQFLGKVITMTSNGVEVVDKPEVRKAGGVYYTPQYIVDYIVSQTLGKFLGDKTPENIVNLTILDPACGSGSFLLGAYRYLLAWYEQWYQENDAAKGRKQGFLAQRTGKLRLTLKKRGEILRDHIFGVDKDAQAVEVAKFSLFLKYLEEENESIVQNTAQRLLPDMDENIKCGNSLIETDFKTTDSAELQSINPFNWQTEFPKIMAAGGFDIVVGNPPWVSLSGKFRNEISSQREVDYLIERFEGNTYMPNVYEYFVYQGINLTKDQGYFSFIVPDRLGFNNQFVQLRKRILTKMRIISLSYKLPFPGITADTLAFVFLKSNEKGDNLIHISEYGSTEILCQQKKLLIDPCHIFEFFENNKIMELITKIYSLTSVIPISELCESTSGFGGKSDIIQKDKTSPEQIATVKGDSIGRYEIRKSYWFDFKRENITGRTTNKTKLGSSPKILLRKTGDKIIATYDDSGIFPEQSLYFLFDNQTNMNFKFILGILNSQLLTAYYRAKSLTNKRSIPQVKKVDLDQLPIRTINFADPHEKAQHDQLVSLVEKMLELHKETAEAKNPQQKTILERQINATDQAIDTLVYELYGLTAEEIALVEASQSTVQ